jgi:hypothetical protein
MEQPTNVFDPDYTIHQRIYILQQQALARNSQALQVYRQACADWQTNAARARDNNLPIPPLPAMPQRQTISDSGVETWDAFPGLLPPFLPPPSGVPSAGGIAAQGTLDKQDVIMAMLRGIYAAQQALAADVAAIKEKLGV